MKMNLGIQKVAESITENKRKWLIRKYKRHLELVRVNICIPDLKGCVCDRNFDDHGLQPIHNIMCTSSIVKSSMIIF